MGTVQDFHETWRGSGIGWVSNSSGRGDGSATRKFTAAVTKDTLDGEVLADVRCPQAGDAHPYAPHFRAREATATRVSQILVEVDVVYRTETDGTGGSADPTEDEADIDWGTRNERHSIDVDANGRPIVNANGERFPVERDFHDLSVVLVKNVAVWNPIAAYRIMNTTNSAPFLAFPAGTCLLKTLTARRVKEGAGPTGDDPYYVMRGEFAFRFPHFVDDDPALAWYRRLRHEGYYEKITQGGTDYIEHARDPLTGEKVTRPVSLIWDWDDYPNGSPGADHGKRETDTDIGHFFDVKLYPETDHNEIGFDV